MFSCSLKVSVQPEECFRFISQQTNVHFERELISQMKISSKCFFHSKKFISHFFNEKNECTTEALIFFHCFKQCYCEPILSKALLSRELMQDSFWNLSWLKNSSNCSLCLISEHWITAALIFLFERGGKKDKLETENAKKQANAKMAKAAGASLCFLSVEKRKSPVECYSSHHIHLPYFGVYQKTTCTSKGYSETNR